MSSPLNYGTPSSLSTPRSLLRGAMTPARQRADLRGHQSGPNVPAPTPTRRVSQTFLKKIHSKYYLYTCHLVNHFIPLLIHPCLLKTSIILEKYHVSCIVLIH